MPELILAGGGLANGLLAARLAATRPDVSFLVLEGGPTLGGNHTWSFHGSDVSLAQLEWLKSLCTRTWEGHDVKLPGTERTLGGTYHSIVSHDFDQRLRAVLGNRVRLSTRIESLTSTSVTLSTGERLDATAVIDALGKFGTGPCGYQKFLGRELELDAPHGLTRPLLMDATVEQLDGFRFVYFLPWDERRVLVEDTYYSDTAAVDLLELGRRIDAVVAARGWRVASVLREESAALPIPLSGDAPVFERPTLGVSGGFFHATTGYSLPFAAALAERVAARHDFNAAALTTELARAAQEHWRSQSFFRTLNRMLFLGAEPAERVNVFSSFYRLDEAAIAHFYAGRMTAWEKLKALRRGAPTVPAMKALRAVMSSR
ncbi:MAG: lycopene beta-cyclase CrtY [Myxococcaceae bacterium]